MQVVSKIVGWLVIVGGSLASVGVFYIDHMNTELWVAMVISVAVSLAVGGVVLWLAGRWSRQANGAHRGDASPKPEDERR